MSTAKRVRRVFSVKEELLKKSREAALVAVQIFNNPNVTFKSETYIVLRIERKQYGRTKNGVAFKHWELERCLNEEPCPLEREVVQNLKFLIGLRWGRL